MARYVKMDPPTWEYAVTIHMQVLENPHAAESTKRGAREEILRLAQMVDRRMEMEEAQDKAAGWSLGGEE